MSYISLTLNIVIHLFWHKIMNIIIYYIFVTDMYFLYLFRFVLNSQVRSQVQAPQCQVLYE